jgi:hypothetical protein
MAFFLEASFLGVLLFGRRRNWKRESARWKELSAMSSLKARVERSMTMRRTDEPQRLEIDQTMQTSTLEPD